MLDTLVLAAAVASACCPPCGTAIERQAEEVLPESPRSVSGAIVSTSEDSINVRTADGTVEKVSLTPGWIVGTARAAKVDDVKIGDFVASINLKVEPGRGKANELRVFEAGYLPEIGTHLMPMPNTMITHGWLFAKRGSELDVYYPGGCRVLQVPEETKVTIYDRRDRSLAVPGAAVMVVTRRDKDGVFRAGRIVVTPAAGHM